ncbi:MAG: tetratricopeptide repeat protein [Actinomycetota bacterium]
MRHRSVLVLACFGLVGLVGACSPPAALRRLAGRDPARAPALPAPPPTPKPPSRAMFGVVVITNDAGWSSVLPHASKAGALIIDVIPGTPAEKAGVQAGEVITGIDDHEIHNHDAVLVAFRSTSDPAHRVTVVTPEGEPRALDTLLEPAGTLSLSDHLRRRFQEKDTPVSRFLMAQNVATAEEALTLLRPLVQKVPRFAPAQALLARRLLEQAAEKLLSSQTLSSAEQRSIRSAVTRATSLDPKSADIRVVHARALLFLGDGAGGERQAAQAVRLDPTSGEAHHILGLSRLVLERPREAMAPLHEAIALDPYNVDYYVGLARAYRAVGHNPQAQQTIDAGKSLVDDPEEKAQLDQLVNSR